MPNEDEYQKSIQLKYNFHNLRSFVTLRSGYTAWHRVSQAAR